MTISAGRMCPDVQNSQPEASGGWKGVSWGSQEQGNASKVRAVFPKVAR